MILRLAVSVEHRLVTDGRTDSQTDRHATTARPNTRTSYRRAGKSGGRYTDHQVKVGQVTSVQYYLVCVI